MKIIKIITLLSVIATSVITSSCLIVNQQKIDKQIAYDIDRKEHNKFVFEMYTIINNQTYPQIVTPKTEIINVKADNYNLTYFLRSKESYRPGEENGPKIQQYLELMENMMKNNLCNKSYFQKLPITLEFIFLTEGKKYNPDSDVFLSIKSKDICI